VTHDFPLTEWERAFKLANSLDSIKVLLKPQPRS
jgi:L-iditol 2-dehydrogenase